MIKKTGLIISVMIFTTSVMASPQYRHCLDKADTPVCKAYLAGIESGKQQNNAKNISSVTEKNKTADNNDLLNRALKQRAGGRYQSSKLTE